ncbi:MAG: sulfurtransferase complex subunit TusB [Gammaproteobacteria bacterium]
MLHFIFQSPIESAVFERLDSGDVVIFFENAVLRVFQHGNMSDMLTKQLSKNRLCVLSDDIAVRGINPDELVKGIEVINYTELVELTVNNPLIQSWA